jgi:hypothetical protein
MFLGEDAAAEVLRDTVHMVEAVRGSMGEVPGSRLREQAVYTAVCKTAPALPVPELLRTVLGYLRDAVGENTAGQMLSLAAMYGLSGAMADILAGKYGEVGEDPEAACEYELECPAGLGAGDSFTVEFETGKESVVVPEGVAPGTKFLVTPKREELQAACDRLHDGIDSPVVDRASLERVRANAARDSYFQDELLMLPTCAVGAVLGHGNVVRQAIKLGASIGPQRDFGTSSGRVRVPLVQNSTLEHSHVHERRLR